MTENRAPAAGKQQSGRSWRKGLAWLLFGATLLFSTAGFALFVLNRQTVVPGSWASSPGSRAAMSRGLAALIQYVLMPALSAVLGLMIVNRRPGQRIGWLLVVLGLVGGAAAFIQEWALFGYYTAEQELPGALLAAWIANWLWIVIFSMAMLTPALVPDGRFLSRRWAWATGCWMLLVAGPLMLASFTESPMTSSYHMPNPFFDDFPQTLNDILFVIGVAGILLTTMTVLASVIARFRGSQGRERQQIKWLMGGMSLMALSVVIGFALSLGLNSRLGDVLVTLSLVWPLLGIGVALMRYHLYDIDIILRGTLTYGLLTAVLAIICFGAVVVLQTLFGWLTGEQSPVVIVMSTLFIAALFAPLRGRLQAVIDRRFFRQKYNAEQVLAHFAEHARDALEPEALERELLAAIQETMRPESASVWIRPAEGVTPGRPIRGEVGR